jgi:hypothetical protein
MRSHDYCHFEVVLGTEGEAVLEYVGGSLEITGRQPLALEQIDALRKAAARLADKAVEQFKISKRDAEERLSAIPSGWARREAEKIRAKAEADRSPEEQAELKAFDDAVFRANREPYDYQDRWSEDDEE